MATDVEAGFVRLKEILQFAADASTHLPATVSRNESLRGLFGEVEGSSKAYLNLVDGDPRKLAEPIDDNDYGSTEFYQHAAIEWIVREGDRGLLETRFDEGVSAIAVALRMAIDDPAWDNLKVTGFERANLSTGALPGIKAGRISVAFLLTAPDLLGNII